MTTASLGKVPAETLAVAGINSFAQTTNLAVRKISIHALLSGVTTNDSRLAEGNFAKRSSMQGMHENFEACQKTVRGIFRHRKDTR